MTFRLLLTEALPEPGMARLRARPDVGLEILTEPSEAELARRIRDADAVIVVLERPFLTAEMVGTAGRLRVACRCGAGADNLAVAALSARGIPVATAGDANADAVAEHALYLLLALAKRGPARDRRIRAGEWPRRFGAAELRGGTCLVVGYGAIGRRVARLASAFGMRIDVHDPYAGDRVAADGFVPVSLPDGLGAADAAILACPLTPETRGLVGARELARMKSTAFLVNVARGPVLDEAALAASLAAGRLGGAGLDVFAAEPLPAASPLRDLENVVLTPHTAAFVETAYDRMAIVAAERALAGLDGRLGPADVVNPEVFGTRQGRPGGQT